MLREYFCAGTTPRYWRLSALLMTLYLGSIALALVFGPGFTTPWARAAAALAPVDAKPSPFFRFPYLASTWFLQATLTMDGTIPLGVEIDSDDYFRDGPKQTLARLLARLDTQGSGIVLFHDIHPKTVLVLPLFLEALARRGYHVVQLVDDQPNPFNQPVLTAGQPLLTAGN